MFSIFLYAQVNLPSKHTKNIHVISVIDLPPKYLNNKRLQYKKYGTKIAEGGKTKPLFFLFLVFPPEIYSGFVFSSNAWKICQIFLIWFTCAQSGKLRVVLPPLPPCATTATYQSSSPRVSRNINQH